MGGGMMGGGADAATPTPVPITGLILSGHGVILGTANASEAIKAAAEGLREQSAEATPADPAAPATTPTPDTAAPAPDTPTTDAEPPAEAAAELTPEQRLAQAVERARQQATPELAFLELLKASDLFDPDKEYTGIVSYVPPQNIDNLSTFVIQVKFKEPFDVNQIGR